MIQMIYISLRLIGKDLNVVNGARALDSEIKNALHNIVCREPELHSLIFRAVGHISRQI